MATVKEIALEALTRTDDEGVGLHYQDVLGIVKDAFPRKNTSMNCIRWYAAQVLSLIHI